MSGQVLLRGGTVVSSFEPPVVHADGAVVWSGERIVAVGPEAELAAQFPAAKRLDAGGGLVLPGLVNLHQHVLGVLARGLDPGFRVRSFGDLLDGLWWRLDRVVTPEMVRVAARFTVAECARWGTTTVFLHHSSPSCLRTSLDILAEACAEVGLSAAICYAASDRNGHHEALAGIDENAVFGAQHRTDPRIRGMFGLHASFTVRDATLRAVAERRPPHAGVHLHLAEDLLDVQASKLIHGAGPIARLERFGLVDERALLVHGVHLAREEVEAVSRAGATLVHCPESNAAHGVGQLELDHMLARGCRVGVGTCGVSPSVLSQLRFSALTRRSARRDPSLGDDVVGLLAHSARVAAELFGEPDLGRLVAGAPADAIVLEHIGLTPVTAANLAGHLRDAATSSVRHVIARGRAVVRDWRLMTLDLGAIASQARELVPRLWARFAALEPQPR